MSSHEKPTCEHCDEREATCVGMYEDMDHLMLACDDCCAHGCEDGVCYRLAGAES